MKIILSVTMASVLFLLAAVNPCVIRADEAKESPAVSTAGAAASGNDQLFVSSSALRVLRHIVQARADIREKNLPRALDELKQSLALLDTIRAMDPADTVRSLIWVTQKQLTYDGSEIVVHDLTALYNAVGNMNELAGGARAREHIGNARKALESGDKKSAGDELVLADEALLDTEIELPVGRTRKYVEKAAKLLAKKQPQKADVALKSAEDGIKFLSITDYSPMAQSRRSLLRAYRNYMNGKLEAAGADLREAKAYLEKVTQSADASLRTDAEKLTRDTEAAEAKARKWDQETSKEIRDLYLRAKELAVKEASIFRVKKAKGKG